MTAIFAGLLAAVFGGSNVQVSGPTGAMTVVLVPLVATFGPRAVLLVGMMAGALLIVAALARIGRYLGFVPWPVIEGFTIGIATIIFLQQVPSALGVARAHSDSTIIVAIRAVRDAIDQGRLVSLGLVILVIAIVVTARRIHRTIPASLAGVVVATLVVRYAHLKVATIGKLPSGLTSPSLPMISVANIKALLPAAAAVAILAGLESLLSAKVADGIGGVGRHDPDRELFGQGVANLFSPLFGGIPATGAIARTAVNVRAGARTRVAAIVHSLLLIGVVMAGSRLVAAIPMAALAGVLMVTSVRMIERHNVRAVMRSTRSDALVLLLTAGATVLFDLITAVEIGLAVAAVLALRHVARTATVTAETVSARGTDDEITPALGTELLTEHILTYRLDGALFFGAAQRFLTELTAVKAVRVVILRLPQLQVLDATGAQALGEIVAELEGRGVTVLLKGARPEHLRLLRAVGALEHLAHERHIFENLEDALAHAHRHLDGNHTPES